MNPVGTYYKLTDENGRSRGGMLWAEGLQNEATGEGTKLCTDGVLHAYETPELAVFMAPAHVTWTKLRMFEVEGEPVANDGTKLGFKTLRVAREIAMPNFKVSQHVAFAILCVLRFGRATEEWKLWAERWLSGKDRSGGAAEVAAWAAAGAAAGAAARAAWAAAEAANCSARAAAAEAAAAAARAAPDLKQTALDALKF